MLNASSSGAQLTELSPTTSEREEDMQETKKSLQKVLQVKMLKDNKIETINTDMMQIVPPKVLRATLVDIGVQNPTVRSLESEYLVEDCIGSTFHLEEDHTYRREAIKQEEEGLACPRSLQTSISIHNIEE